MAKASCFEVAVTGKGISQRSPLGDVGILHLRSREGVMIPDAASAGYIDESTMTAISASSDSASESDEKLGIL
jgi:hypothetical protein